MNCLDSVHATSASAKNRIEKLIEDEINAEVSTHGLVGGSVMVEKVAALGGKGDDSTSKSKTTKIASEQFASKASKPKGTSVDVPANVQALLSDSGAIF
jgi:hypothetical protein